MVLLEKPSSDSPDFLGGVWNLHLFIVLLILLLRPAHIPLPLFSNFDCNAICQIKCAKHKQRNVWDFCYIKAATENSTGFWDMMPCTLVNMSVNRASFPIRGKYLVVFEGAEAAVGPTHWVPGGLYLEVKRLTCLSVQYRGTTLSLY